jgi:hypothetical protein
MTTRTITNHVPRFTIDACELTPAERAEFDYLPWNEIDRGEDSATFIRYRGELHDLGNFIRSDDPESPWDGIAADSAFSATVVKIVDDDRVIVGRMYS